MNKYLRSIGLGRAIYYAYHLPRSMVERSKRENGLLEQWRNLRGRRAMMRAAGEMPNLSAEIRSAEPITVNFLTGRNYWYQSVFCARSLSHAAERPIDAVVYDDGTLSSEQFAAISRVCIRANLVSPHESESRLNQYLPTAKFPSLRARREALPLMRKLLDIHAGRSGWRLFLDSDLLFFREPTLLLNWLAHPTRPLRATDIKNAYGYPLQLLAELAGADVPEKVNTGILGLRSEAIDWAKLEWWTARLVARGGPQYYQEQALVALMLAGQDHTAAPIEDYVTYPQPPEALTCNAVMHHYVAESKRWYFQHNWRRFLQSVVPSSVADLKGSVDAL